jgi:hypothetical protein
MLLTQTCKLHLPTEMWIYVLFPTAVQKQLHIDTLILWIIWPEWYLSVLLTDFREGCRLALDNSLENKQKTSSSGFSVYAQKWWICRFPCKLKAHVPCIINNFTFKNNCPNRFSVFYSFSHTYEVAPAFIVIEMYLMEKLCSIVGYKTGDGIFCPGTVCCLQKSF